VSRLHKTDGTTTGTVQEAFIGADGDVRDAPYYGVTLNNGYAVFVADNGTDGPELYRTGPSTAQLVDIHPSAGSDPDQFVLLDAGHALFTADDGDKGRELWITDGTDTGTMMVKDIRDGSIGSRISMSTSGALNGYVYFTADDGINGKELWRSDGTEAGTTMVYDVTGDATSGAEESPWVAGGFVFFRGIDGTGVEPWVSDGTTTVRLADVNGAGDSSPSEFTAAGGTIFFQAISNGDRQLWKTDGTPGNTSLVKDLNSGGNDQVGGVVPFGTSVIFGATDDTSGVEPFISDGNDATLITEVEAGNAASVQRFAAHGSVVTFVGDNGLNGEEMWVTGGTQATTMQLVDAYPGLTDGYQADLTVSGDLRFYWAQTNGSGVEPWVTDGTIGGTFMLRDICPATCDSAVTD
jgi:ELWxxDGT repeat protein